MKIKSGFAPIRDGLLEHMIGISPMEAKIYLMQHLIAKRTGPDRGKVFTSLSELSRLSGHARLSVRRAVQALEKNHYLKAIPDGWLILNYEGDKPEGVVNKLPWSKNDQKVVNKLPGGWSKNDQKVVNKLPPTARKSKKRKPLSTPLDVDVNIDVDGKRRKAPPAGRESWPTWYPEITWNKEKRQVEITDDARESLSAHLQDLAQQENITVLKEREAQRSWGRLNGWLMRNRQCRGPNSLPPIVVNWFENDLRDPNRIRGSTSKSQRTEEVFDEAIRKAEEEERGKNLIE